MGTQTKAISRKISNSGTGRGDSPDLRSQTFGQAPGSISQQLPQALPENASCNTSLNKCCKYLAAFVSETVASNHDPISDGLIQYATAGYIYGYIRILFTLFKLEPECCVYAAVYIRRLLSKTKSRLVINEENWDTVVVAACLLASKYADDSSMQNIDFSAGLTRFSREFINKLESQFLHMSDWKMHVPISEYTAQYFEMVNHQPAGQSCDWYVDVEEITPHFAIMTNGVKALISELRRSRSW